MLVTTGKTLTAADFKAFDEQGYLGLGRLLDAEALGLLRGRMEDLMLGRIVYEGMFFQRDAESGRYGDVDPKDTRYSGPSLNYRKVKDLEYDDLFLTYLQNPVFRQLAERYIGPAASCMRAMLMNKPAGSATLLPYHQDVSLKWHMSKAPVMTLWTALDDATVKSGCVEIVPGSHKHGAIGDGHILSAADEARVAPPGSSLMMELRAGEAFVFHNALLHRSGANTADHPRRAFTVCFLEPDTRHEKTGRAFPLVFGPGALTPEAVAKERRVPSHTYD